MAFKIPLADLNFGPEEEQAVVGVVQSRWLTMGGVTQEFEAEFARFTGARHALALSNATVALHLACLSSGIGPGDEVIVPALTFVASANAVLYTGAEVRFAGVCGPHDLNVSPAEIERQITARTRAVLVVHYGGYPCRMPEIMEIARRHNLAVIEDAAHAPGARLDGRHLGLWGEAGCFSFFSNKNLSVGEGGMLVTNRDDVAEKVRLLRSHGMTSLTWDRHKGHAHSYDVVELGYNYRIDEIRSALGLVQLAKLAEGNGRRAGLTRRYWEKLAGRVELPFSAMDVSPGVEPAYHILPILLPAGADRGRFIDSMKTAGIQTSIHYPPVHRFSYYRGRYTDLSLPLTEEIASRQVTLPLYPTLTEDEQDEVVEAVRASLRQAGG
jgi:dTDP-4-amino-4,6-dideoxygalactose transaminase